MSDGPGPAWCGEASPPAGTARGRRRIPQSLIGDGQSETGRVLRLGARCSRSGKKGSRYVVGRARIARRSEEHTSELQSRLHLVCRLLLEKKNNVQDEILTLLSKIAYLKVISRTSTQHYKSAPEHLPELARHLALAHILDRSVQKTGSDRI